MPEARIRVAALHLAGARALPLLCLGVRGGVQSRLVHHACSSLKQQKLSSAPHASHRRTPPYVYAPAATRFMPARLTKFAHPIVAADKKRRTNPCKHCIRYCARQKISVYGRTLARRCLLYTSDAADEEDSVDLGG